MFVVLTNASEIFVIFKPEYNILLMRFLFIFILALTVNFIQAQGLQYEINAASKSEIRDSFVVNWSLGSIPYETYANNEVEISNIFLYEELFHGFPEMESGVDFQLIPNPFFSYINIMIDTQYHMPIIFNIYNVSGSQVFQKILSSNYEIVNLSFLSNGFYVAEFEDKGERLETFKIIKN